MLEKMLHKARKAEDKDSAVDEVDEHRNEAQRQDCQQQGLTSIAPRVQQDADGARLDPHCDGRVDRHGPSGRGSRGAESSHRQNRENQRDGQKRETSGPQEVAPVLHIPKLAPSAA